MISNDAMDAALIRELCSGRMLMEAKQQFREVAAAKEAFDLRGKSNAVLGKPIAVIPSHEFFLIREKYGDEAFKEKGFLRDFQKFHPELSPNKI